MHIRVFPAFKIARRPPPANFVPPPARAMDIAQQRKVPAVLIEQLRQLCILNAVAALRHSRGAISTAVHGKT